MTQPVQAHNNGMIIIKYNYEDVLDLITLYYINTPQLQYVVDYNA